MKSSSNQFSRFQFQTIYSSGTHPDSKKVKSAVNGLMVTLGFNLEFIIRIVPKDEDYLTNQYGVKYQFLAYVGTVDGKRIIQFFMRPDKGLLYIGDYLISLRECSLSELKEDQYLKKRLTEDDLRALAESLIIQYALSGVWNN